MGVDMATVEYEREPAEWLHEGAQVVVIDYYSYGRGIRDVTPTAVARMTRRDIVLANDVRFRHTGRHGSGTDDIEYWATGESRSLLVAADNPRVAPAAHELALSAAKHRAGNAWDAWRNDRTVVNAEALRDAVQGWIDVAGNSPG
jgi:hypothetical protein